MKTASLSLELAKKMYKGTDEELKAFALENYPELGMKITDRLKTFEDVCNETGRDINDFTTTSNDPEVISDMATRRVKLIVKAYNEGWTPDWDNSDEWKYYPWFKMSSSGVGFSYHVYGNAYTLSTVGSRLVFKSKDLAIAAAKQFTEEYKQMLTL